MILHRTLPDSIIVRDWLVTSTRSRFIAKRCGTTHQAVRGVLKRHIPHEDRHAARGVKLRPQRHYRGERASQRCERRRAAEMFFGFRVWPRMRDAEPTTAERSELYWKRKPATLVKARARKNVADFLARLDREASRA